MDLRKVPLFEMMAKKLAWLGARQQVLATNIANSDTPGFKPRDVKPLDFRAMAESHMAPQGPLAPTVTNPAHLASVTLHSDGAKQEKEKHPIETSISGNAVTLEEELMKANKTASDYELTTNLYHKHLSMIRDALGH